MDLNADALRLRGLADDWQVAMRLIYDGSKTRLSGASPETCLQAGITAGMLHTAITMLVSDIERLCGEPTQVPRGHAEAPTHI